MVDYPRVPIKPLSASSEQLHKADAWFQDFYCNYAEPYAKGSEDIIDTETSWRRPLSQVITLCGPW